MMLRSLDPARFFAGAQVAAGDGAQRRSPELPLPLSHEAVPPRSLPAAGEEPFLVLPRLRSQPCARDLPPSEPFGFPGRAQVGEADSTARAFAAGDAAGSPALKQPSGGSATRDPATTPPPPASRSDLPPGDGAGGGIRANVIELVAARVEQIERWGHTPARDREQPIDKFLGHMLAEIQRYAIAAADDRRANTGLGQVRQRVVRIGALCLATLERLDAEPCDG